jgi:hypothetical protein
MQDIVSSDYALYRAWFERSLDLVWHMSPEVRASVDPMAAVAKAESVSASKGVKSVAAGIADTVGMTDRHSADEITAIDSLFKQEGLPTLTFMRKLFSRRIRRILKSGKVETEDDYYALKAVEDADLPERSRAKIAALLGEYELSLQAS